MIRSIRSGVGEPFIRIQKIVRPCIYYIIYSAPNLSCQRPNPNVSGIPSVHRSCGLSSIVKATPTKQSVPGKSSCLCQFKSTRSLGTAGHFFFAFLVNQRTRDRKMHSMMITTGREERLRLSMESGSFWRAAINKITECIDTRDINLNRVTVCFFFLSPEESLPPFEI